MFLAGAWQSLQSLDPALPWVALPTLIWLLNWFVRWKFPRAWQWVAELGPSGAWGAAWQAAPSAVIGSVTCAAAVGLNPRDLALAAVVSLVAPLGHEALRSLTARFDALPTYLGGSFPAAGGAVPPSTTSLGSPGDARAPQPTLPDAPGRLAIVPPSPAPGRDASSTTSGDSPPAA